VDAGAAVDIVGWLVSGRGAREIADLHVQLGRAGLAALAGQRLRISGRSMSDDVSAGATGKSVPRDRQVAWQRRAVALLGVLPQRAEPEALPVVEREVGDVGPSLRGRCGGPSAAAQVEAFDAWHVLLGRADRITEDQTGSGL
jgi:hypothetical protein